jgi:ubiquinone/menaquinone biosynthesis C-methylase UbiE
MHEKRFNRAIERLRDPDRVQRLEVAQVVDQALLGGKVRSVLDVGTGTGLFAEEFATHGLQVSGLDANPEMLPVAAEFVKTGNFKEGIAEALPFEDDAFDLVFMGLVFHEADDQAKAMQEAYRVARHRLAVLEWPYREQEFGPGLEERLTAARMAEFGAEAGFISIETIEFKNLVLYIFEK